MTPVPEERNVVEDRRFVEDRELVDDGRPVEDLRLAEERKGEGRGAVDDVRRGDGKGGIIVDEVRKGDGEGLVDVCREEGGGSVDDVRNREAEPTEVGEGGCDEARGLTDACGGAEVVKAWVSTSTRKDLYEDRVMLVGGPDVESGGNCEGEGNGEDEDPIERDEGGLYLVVGW